MKSKFLLSGVLILVAPILVILLVAAAMLFWFFTFHPEYLLPGYGLMASDVFHDPLFQRGLIVWLFLSLIIIFGSSLLSVVTHTSALMRPLSELKRAAENIKTGNLDFEIMNSKYEEINELCQAFEDMRQRLKEMEQLQQEYDKERSMLIANVSHDLRTPITSIKGYVEGILDGVASTPEKQAEYLRTIYQKAQLLEELVESMSEFSAYEMKRVRYDFEFKDIVPILSDFIEDYRLDLESEGIELHSSFPEKELVVMVDQGKFCRVLSNVVINAVKYRKNNESLLKFIVEHKENGVLITVSDNGKGIRAEDLQRVFESHFRTDRSRNSEVKGHGLGLSIARQIIEAHKGKIWLKSQEDIGTNVYIYLPLRRTVAL